VEKPWYQDGLRFECTRCGNCCTGAPGYVWVDDDEIAALAETAGVGVEEFTALYTRQVGRRRTLRERLNGDCVFWDRRTGCTVYEHRPGQCRTWPFWESNVESPEAWERMKAGCPGAGRGELIPVEEIVRRVNVIRL
jgi:Fe-S-cluster containining protein